MYARYVPPKKARPAAPVQAEPEQPAVPAAIAPPGQLYARYVPPPKPATGIVAAPKRKIVFDDDDPEPAAKKPKQDAEEPADVIMTEDAVPKKGSKKKDKKTRKTKSAEDSKEDEEQTKVPQSDTEEVQQDPSTIPDEIADHETTKPPSLEEEEERRKARKEKKAKKKKAAQDGQDAAAWAGAVEDRFKAVLSKKDKSLKRAKNAAPEASEQEPVVATENPEDAIDGQEDIPEFHGLEPLPQPEPANLDTGKPSYDTLPQWLTQPIRVSPQTRTPFSKLGLQGSMAQNNGITSKAEKVLQAKGWKEAFAVQTAVIPLLLPHELSYQSSDIVVSAATGSGKTLAYVLPMIRDLSCDSDLDLKAIIVVPTRELVQQAYDVCETCSRAFAAQNGNHVQVAMATGSQSLAKEQANLMIEELVYDPYWAENQKKKEVSYEDWLLDPNFTPLYELKKTPRYHKWKHVSRVNVLVCTPGRLVDHLAQTEGFTLAKVRWLVIDEADKLLGQRYQGWVETVMEKLKGPGRTVWGDDSFTRHKRVRKVILSATMTRDLSLLQSLNLSRPKHVLLEGSAQSDEALVDGAIYTVPETLEESAIKVREESQKPLYLVDLLNSSQLSGPLDGKKTAGAPRRKPAGDSDDSDTSSSGSDTSDSSDSDSDSNSDVAASLNSKISSLKVSHNFPTTVLIFTKSNENAMRLSRLLAILSPDLAPIIGTLTSLTRDRTKIKRDFAARRLRILVASDLAARGIDFPRVDHVVNYDVPPSVEFYVHRVGRTARAGRKGQAWTLFTKREAGWFWPEVAGEGKRKGTGGTIRRLGKVTKVNLGWRRGGAADGDEKAKDGVFSEERLSAYEDALEKLGQEAKEEARGWKRK